MSCIFSYKEVANEYFIAKFIHLETNIERVTVIDKFWKLEKNPNTKEYETILV